METNVHELKGIYKELQRNRIALTQQEIFSQNVYLQKAEEKIAEAMADMESAMAQIPIQ